MNISLRRTIIAWSPIAVATIGIIMFAYIGMYQIYRAQLNEPQVRMVEDTVRALERGAQPSEVVPRGDIINPATSLSPFIAVYDEDGRPLEANAMLSGLLPKPPVGVFAHALSTGENRVTWQPEGSVRIALVVKPVPNSRGWYVASGRSLKDGEILIENLGMLAFRTAVLILLITFGLELFKSRERMYSQCQSENFPTQ